MWKATHGGRVLTFHLAGINNQNFIMRDDETGSWWQQASGDAIFGPLEGTSLEPVVADELSFATWRAENGGGRVLVPDDSTPWREFSEDWEAKTARLRVTTSNPDAGPLAPRELVIGVQIGGASKAYPLAELTTHGAIVDEVGGVPIVVVLGDDGTSFRVFERRVDGVDLNLYRAQTGVPGLLVDETTGSTLSFAGRGVAGPLEGRQLPQLKAIKDYWFDWKAYNPDTAIYSTPSIPR